MATLNNVECAVCGNRRKPCTGSTGIHTVVGSEHKTLYYPGWASMERFTIGKAYRFKYCGQDFRGRVVELKRSESKMRNAGRSLIAMPQTTVVVEVLPMRASEVREAIAQRLARD